MSDKEQSSSVTKTYDYSRGVLQSSLGVASEWYRAALQIRVIKCRYNFDSDPVDNSNRHAPLAGCCADNTIQMGVVEKSYSPVDQCLWCGEH